MTLLAHLEKTLTSSSEGSAPLYVFCETGEHQWGELGEIIDQRLKEKGLVSKEICVEEDKEDNETETGTQSRAHAELLRKWGWKIVEKQTVQESVVEDIDYMIKEKMI